MTAVITFDTWRDVDLSAPTIETFCESLCRRGAAGVWTCMLRQPTWAHLQATILTQARTEVSSVLYVHQDLLHPPNAQCVLKILPLPC